MSHEIKIDNRTAKVDILSRSGNKILIAIDDRKYEIDIEKVGTGLYSILNDGKSYSVELIGGANPKHYTVNTYAKTFDVEVIDAETKYLQSRGGTKDDDAELHIMSPMPGKIVKVPVKVGDEVKEGQTIVVVEAMKMQSEFKVKKDRIIKEIYVKEGDTVDANQILIELE